MPAPGITLSHNCPVISTNGISNRRSRAWLARRMRKSLSCTRMESGMESNVPAHSLRDCSTRSAGDDFPPQGQVAWPRLSETRAHRHGERESCECRAPARRCGSSSLPPAPPASDECLPNATRAKDVRDLNPPHEPHKPHYHEGQIR